MRYLTVVFLAILPLATVCPTAVGQAAAEYGLGAGRAATTTAPARHVGTSMSDLFGSLSKAAGADAGTAAPAPASPGPEARPTATRKTGRRTRAKPSTKPVVTKAATEDATPATPPSAAAPAPVYEDPQQIQAGIGYDEMVRRFGPPSMSVTTETGTNTLWYSSRDGNYQVEVKDGKVIAGPGKRSE